MNMGRTAKPKEPSELEQAIRAIETRIESLQLALAALLDVQSPYRPPAGRPTLAPSDTPPVAIKPARSHKPKAEKPAEDLGL